MVDVESDGPYAPKYSMICFGAVFVDNPKLAFYGQLAPISDNWLPEALAVSGFTRTDTLLFTMAKYVMKQFSDWVERFNVSGRPMFISDNNGYDWSFMNYYLWEFTGKNVFGHSSTNLGSLYKGLVRDLHKNFKHLRETKHTHNPVDDCMGNVEAFKKMWEMGLK